MSLSIMMLSCLIIHMFCQLLSNARTTCSSLSNTAGFLFYYLHQKLQSALVGQWYICSTLDYWSTGRHRSCTRGMIHNKIHFLIPGCPPIIIYSFTMQHHGLKHHSFQSGLWKLPTEKLLAMVPWENYSLVF